MGVIYWNSIKRNYDEAHSDDGSITKLSDKLKNISFSDAQEIAKKPYIIVFAISWLIISVALTPIVSIPYAIITVVIFLLFRKFFRWLKTKHPFTRTFIIIWNIAFLGSFVASPFDPINVLLQNPLLEIYRWPDSWNFLVAITNGLTNAFAFSFVAVLLHLVIRPIAGRIGPRPPMDPKPPWDKSRK